MTLAPGTHLGPYEIVSQLGSGGMGVVYTATDPHLKRTVAIKLLHPDLTRDDIAKQRFLQERLRGRSIQIYAPLNALPVGSVIARTGEGGMGEVYRVAHKAGVINRA